MYKTSTYSQECSLAPPYLTAVLDTCSLATVTDAACGGAPMRDHSNEDLWIEMATGAKTRDHKGSFTIACRTADDSRNAT
jgi:hypothetical protein